MNIKEAIKNNLEEIKALRRTLNENPELSYREFKTQEIIINKLNSLGIRNFKCAKTGVIGMLNEGETCIAVRADMDALPINGVSHACGHDYHMSIALGAALVLKELDYKGAVKFIFQPAEELEGGAYPMIQEGALLNPKVEKIIGYHVWPGLEVGKIEAQGGATMGSIDDFHITIKGIGGHAAMPQHCKNPIFPAIEIIQSVNMKSRSQVDPLNSHVITFSAINGGTATNVIPKEVTLQGTVRTFDEKLRYTLADMIKSTAETIAKSYGCDALVSHSFEYPPVICDEELTRSFINASVPILGEENILPVEKTFGGDDFAYFSLEIPAVHFRLGIAKDHKGMHPLHSPYFDGDDDALFYGIYAVVNFIINGEY